ncbi:hypothetical protein [Mesorhizobium sp.]|uniref:hypothetical protein n=1 Tax=Mesorhizobium sp. TaxID=1871066 RepID=UPI000FE619A2|nr:hypothetical protein [Mesorhizobium sp.]RWP79957.1 MAG: hypothetical protein EOR09_01780 [Mesorhizobium sp.]RWQ65634.1 MAG: hypothetical protein EOS86_13835 [Mesorhizobium sp.]
MPVLPAPGCFGRIYGPQSPLLAASTANFAQRGPLAGFRRIEFPLVAGYWLTTPPYRFLHGIERALQRLPARLRRNQLAGVLMGITAVATK